MTGAKAVAGIDESGGESRRRRLDQDEVKALWAAGFAFAVVVMYAIASWFIDRDASPWIAVAAGCVGIGVFTAARGFIGVGVVGLGVFSVLMMDDQPPGRALAIGAVAVTVCLIVVTLSDLSFVMRRGTRVADQTLAGIVGFQVIAWALGVAASVAVVIAVTSVTLPGWLAVIAIVALVIAVFMVQRRLRRFQRELRALETPVASTMV